jgi:hypothetical protein
MDTKKTIYKVFVVGKNSDETIYSKHHSDEVSIMDAYNTAKKLMDEDGIATKIQSEIVTSH